MNLYAKKLQKTAAVKEMTAFIDTLPHGYGQLRPNYILRLRRPSRRRRGGNKSYFENDEFGLVIILNSNGSYDINTCGIKLKDTQNYQIELQKFKQSNSW